jgi:hypothetical protein
VIPFSAQAYLARLAWLARSQGIDSERLEQEVSDHLTLAAQKLRSETACNPSEAERLAIEAFGPPETLVRSMVEITRGGTMNRLVRLVAWVVAAASTAVLMVAQVVPSTGVAGTGWEVAIVVSAVALAAALLAIALTSGRWLLPRAGRSTGRWLLLWVVPSALLGVVGAWGYGRISLGPVVMHQGGRLYFAVIAALGLLAAGAAKAAGERSAIGAAFLLAGALSIGLNGAFDIRPWQPFGGFGSGNANMGVILFLTGWGFVTVSWLAGSRTGPARARFGSWLVSAGRRLATDSAGP